MPKRAYSCRYKGVSWNQEGVRGVRIISPGVRFCETPYNRSQGVWNGTQTPTRLLTTSLDRARLSYMHLPQRVTGGTPQRHRTRECSGAPRRLYHSAGCSPRNCKSRNFELGSNYSGAECFFGEPKSGMDTKYVSVKYRNARGFTTCRAVRVDLD
jgi:hypothetical protein